jgi:UDP-glucose 4-epimerase
MGHESAGPAALGPAVPEPLDLASTYQGRRALVTGGLGLIGSMLARRLVELGARVTILDALAPGSSANLHNVAPVRDHIQLETVDVRCTDRVRTLLTAQDYLFNLAGQSSHVSSMAEPFEDLEVNCRAQLAVLEACRDVNPGIVIVFASTRQIYGRSEYLPVDERHPLAPVDVNGVAKMAGEAFHLMFHRVFGLKVAALRLTNTYGPGMRIKDARQMFMGIWLRRLIEGTPFEVWGGAQKRDFTYVDDAAQAFLFAAAMPKCHGRAFNLGGKGVVTLTELAELLVRANGGGEFIVRQFPPERASFDIGDYYADDRLFRGLTGWHPTVPLEAGVALSLSYFREHLPHYV